MTYYYGGVGGRKRGDIIEPDPDKLTEIGVEVHTVRDLARLRAAGVPGGGALYVVEPLGPAAEFADDRTIYYAKARVVSVYDAVVRPTPAQLRRLWAKVKA